jgi:hypothetical protein
MNKREQILKRTGALDRCIQECDQSGEPLSDGITRRVVGGGLLVITADELLVQNSIDLLKIIESQSAETGGPLGVTLETLIVMERIALVGR